MIAAENQKTWSDRVPQPLLIAGFGLFIVAIWQLAVSTGQVSEIILPGPVKVFDDFVFTLHNLFTGGYVWEATMITFTEVIQGFLLASVTGLVLGVIVGETRFGARAIMPYLVAVNAMPKVAFAPVFVAWFGFGITSKVMMAAFVSFFPVTVNTATGLNSTNPDMVMLFRSIEASRWQTLVKLKIPAALPYIFAGLKLAAVFSIIGAVVGEYMGGGEGLGELVRIAASQLNIGRVFAQIFLLSVLGMSLFGAITLLERLFASWAK
jgi:NitT/TauT family transport system permease protein